VWARRELDSLQATHPGTVIFADNHLLDSFAIPETDARFHWYGWVYYGDSAIDGSGFAPPEYGCSDAFVTYRAAYDTRMQETGGMSPVLLSGSCSIRQDSGRFGGDLGPGTHTLAWDGFDGRGVRAPAGIYFMRLSARSGATATKLALR
jgi:hypothetical protein